MVKRLKIATLVKPSDIKPSRGDFRVVGVFNPGAARFKDEIYLLARVAETFIEKREGYFFSPRYVFDGGKPRIEIDSFPINYGHSGDVRKYEDDTGYMRLAFISHLRLVKLDKTGFKVTYIDEKPAFYPEFSYEEYGVEDPRITYLDGTHYFTYVAVSKDMGVSTALASTDDFIHFKRRGVIFCHENKDVVILPEKFGGKYCAYHRPVGLHQFAPPCMQIVFSPDLKFWGEHKLLMANRTGLFDQDRMGAGTVPVKTSKGWLEIYHGVKLRDPEDPIGVYSAGAALFDLKDPSKLIGRSREPILSPEDPSEAAGFVKNVIFPTAAVMAEDNEHIILFSGGADTAVTATLLSLEEIMESLE